MLIGFNANNENIHISDGYGYKLYTYGTSTKKPLTTYKDRDGKYPNQNPAVLDVNGDATVYLLPTLAYTFVLVDRDDKVVSVTHDVKGGLYNTSLLTTISNIETSQETLSDLLDRASEANIDILNLDALLDEKAALVHTHKASEVLNLQTGVASDANCACGYWELQNTSTYEGSVQVFLEAAGTPDSGHAVRTLTRGLDEGLLGTYFNITNGNLVCAKDCNVLVDMSINNMLAHTAGHVIMYKNGTEYANGFHVSNDYIIGGVVGVIVGGFQNMFVTVPISLVVGDVLTFKVRSIEEAQVIYSLCVAVLPTCQVPA